MRATVLAAALLLAYPLAPQAKESSADAQRRGFGKPSFGFRLGAVTAVSSASPDNLTAIGASGYALFDIPDLLADLSLDLYAGQHNAKFIAGGLGAYYPLTDGETVPYLGGGLKIGWTKFGGDGATGLLPFATVGLLMGRNWSPQIRAELSWFYQTGTERRTPESSASHSSGPMFSIGMGF